MKPSHDKNYGLELLRMILCFWVVLFHCLQIYNSNCIILFFKRKMFHVPSFFFISFYFLFPVIKGKKNKKMLQRIERLSIPYFFWPILTWNINNIFFSIFKKSRFGIILSFVELKEQLIIGRKFFSHYWFLFNLLLLTYIFFIIALIFESNNFLKIIRFLSIISYILQYSKINYIFFDRYPDCVNHSVGYIVESFPHAGVAFTLYSSGILNHFKNIRHTIIFYCIIGLFF